jgi:hypothetical protein
MATSAYQNMAIDIGIGLWYLNGGLAALRLFVRIKTDASFWKIFSRQKCHPETVRCFSKIFFP